MRLYSLVIIAVAALAAGGALAADAVFDVVSEAAVTAPPYPTPPIEMRLGGPRHGTVITIHGLNFRSLSAGSAAAVAVVGQAANRCPSRAWRVRAAKAGRTRPSSTSPT
ncbi:MAG: hypothetical protein IPI48_15990 [bacterium]|nr:hypothetical protein [bacterium]